MVILFNLSMKQIVKKIIFLLLLSVLFFPRISQCQDFKFVRSFVSKIVSPAISLSSDGKDLACYDSDKKVVIYSNKSGQIKKEIFVSNAYEISYSPCGKYFVTAGFSEKHYFVKIFRTDDFKLVKLFSKLRDSSVDCYHFNFDLKGKYFELRSGSVKKYFSFLQFIQFNNFVDLDDPTNQKFRRAYSNKGNFFAGINSRFIVVIYSLKSLVSG
ncbi:hypothetical protein KAH55_09975 [bacterium]|nr:hypothetical protein [bacterium]